MLLSFGNFIGFGISAIVTLFISIHLIKGYLKSKEVSVKYFASFITARLGMFVFMALAPLVYWLSGNLLIPTILFFIVWIMIFVSLVFPPMLFSHLKWIKMKKIYPGIIGGVGVIGILMAIIKFTPVAIDPNTGLAFATVPQLSMICYMFCKLFGVLPLSVLFLSQAAKGERWMRIRSFLIGFGLLWVISTLMVPNFIAAPWAGIYCSVGDILIFAGVMHRRP